MSITPSSSAKPKGRFALGCFFTFFLLFGLAMSAVFLWPIVEILQASNWRKVPCTILTSTVESHSSKKSSTYSVEVTYEYVIDDQKYTGNRYKFMGGSSSGRDGKQAIVDTLPPGKQTFCYVNRRDATDAVIERGFTADILFGFIPLLFALIGAGGLFGVFVYKGKPKAAAYAAAIAGPTAPPPPPRAGPAKLKTSSSRIGRLIFAVIFAGFWNAIVSVFLFSCISGWGSGNGDGCMTAFLVPFVLVGLGLIVLVLYFFLGLFNPSPALKLTPSAVSLGDSVEVEWETAGSVDRVKSFKITLEGREEATYRRGTSTSTDKSVFLKLVLFESPRGKELRRGKAKFQIPADSMHTFKSRNNKIVWTLKVDGDIPMWPDIGEEFPFEVSPHRGGPA